MGGVKKGQPGFGSTGHHHDTVLRLCPPGSREQLHAGLTSFYWATEIVRVWGRGQGRKHRQRTKFWAEWLLERAASCGLFRSGEFGRVSDLLHHVHLLNVKTWLFHFPRAIREICSNQNGECYCRQLQATVLELAISSINFDVKQKNKQKKKVFLLNILFACFSTHYFSCIILHLQQHLIYLILNKGTLLILIKKVMINIVITFLIETYIVTCILN